MRFIVLIYFLLTVIPSFSQNSKEDEADSLMHELKKTTNNRKKLYLIFDLSKIYSNQGNYEKHEYWLDKGMAIAKKEKDNNFFASFKNSKAYTYIMQGRFEEAKPLLEENLQFIRKHKLRRREIDNFRWKGLLFIRLGEYENALKQYIEAGKMTDELGDDTLQIFAFEDLGIAYYYSENYKMAAVYWEKELELQLKLNSKKNEICGVYCNLALVYSELNEIKKARDYLKISLNYAEFDLEHCNIYTNLGKIEYEEGNLKEAIIDMEKALKYADKNTEDSRVQANIMSNLCVLYADDGQIDKALELGLKSFNLSLKLKDLEVLSSNSRSLSEAYEKNGNFESALFFKKEEFKYTDSLKNTDRIGNFDELAEKYQSRLTRDSLQISEQKAELEKSNSENLKAESDRKSFIIIGGVAALFLLTGLLFLVFRGRNMARKLNNLLSEKNQLIEQKNKDITDSINYAKRIQDAILTKEEVIKKSFPQSFLLYLPKDIVAGDFYFYEESETHIYYAAADCTGHGVPGAMVSVVCSNALSRCVKEFKLIDPGKFLDKATELVVETFEKSHENVNDGMDISLIVIAKNELQNQKMNVNWAGAFNPLLYFQNGILREIKANKQSVGRSESPEKFNSHRIEISKGDSFYLFTDGYADQFGGPKGKKFKFSSFSNLLKSNASADINYQKKNLVEILKNWQGDLEQVDDVCVIGIRI